MCRFPDLAASTAHRRGCRCERCNHWNNEKQRAVVGRARARARGGRGCQFPKHAATTAYQYGCRCRRCVRLQSERCRIYKQQ